MSPLMRSVLTVGIMQAAITAGVGLFTGALAGASAIIFAHSTLDRAELVAQIYWSLVILMPIGAWFSHDIRSFGEAGRTAYATLAAALLTSGAAALVGALLGAGPLFLFGAINMPIILAGEQATVYSQAVRSAISTEQFLIVLAATVITGISLGVAAHRKVAEVD